MSALSSRRELELGAGGAGMPCVERLNMLTLEAPLSTRGTLAILVPHVSVTTNFLSSRACSRSTQLKTSRSCVQGRRGGSARQGAREAEPLHMKTPKDTKGETNLGVLL